VCGRVGGAPLVIVAGDFEAQRFPEHGFERRDVAVGGPELELGVAGGAQAGQVVVAAGVEVDAREGLRVAAIQPFGESNHGRQPLDGLAQRALQLAVPVM
jgi:hypothetical protein